LDDIRAPGAACPAGMALRWYAAGSAHAPASCAPGNSCGRRRNAVWLPSTLLDKNVTVDVDAIYHGRECATLSAGDVGPAISFANFGSYAIDHLLDLAAITVWCELPAPIWVPQRARVSVTRFTYPLHCGGFVASAAKCLAYPGAGGCCAANPSP